MKDCKCFSESLSDIEHKKQTAESQIILLEDQFESARTKICQIARDTQTNKPIHPETIQKFVLKKSLKDKETRKLLLEKLRYIKVLEELNEEIKESLTYSSQNTQQR